MYEEALQAYKATSDNDSLYYHEAVREPDKEQFTNAMHKEVQDQFDNRNFSVIKRTEVPKGTKIHRAIWQLRRKQDIVTGAIKKWKGRLNLDGSKMVKGID